MTKKSKTEKVKSLRPEDIKNTGFILKAPFITDFVAGAETGITYKVNLESGVWDKYLPKDEDQSRDNPFFDSNSCVTFSALNEIETQCNWALKNNLFTKEQIKELEDLGYIENNKFNFNDAFTAVMSNTTENGNYLQAVADSIRNHGLLPQRDWHSIKDAKSFSEWFKTVPQDLKDKALKIKDYLEIKYEWVFFGQTGQQANIVKHLKQAPLQIASPVCGGWSDGEIVKPCGDTNPTHATTIIGYKAQDHFLVYDHYYPYIKKVSWDYYFAQGMKTVAMVKKPAEIPVPSPTPSPIPTPAPTPLPYSDLTYSWTKDLYFNVHKIKPSLISDIKAMQKGLINLGFLNANPTGNFLLLTQQALIAFQTKYGITPAEGYFGPITRKKFNEIFLKKKPRTLIEALIRVESGGDDFAVGDKHLPEKEWAYGCLQIRPGYCTDINNKFGSKITPKDMLGNRTLSIWAFERYMEIYATPARIGRPVTDQDRARIHNGGPTGYKRSSTLGYWEKVKSALAGIKR